MSKLSHKTTVLSRLNFIKDKDNYESDHSVKESPMIGLKNRNSKLFKTKNDDYTEDQTNYKIQITKEMDKTRKLCENYHLSIKLSYSDHTLNMNRI